MLWMLKYLEDHGDVCNLLWDASKNKMGWGTETDGQMDKYVIK